MSYKIELPNRVTQNDVTLRVTNSKWKNKNLHLELLTPSRKTQNDVTLRVTNSKWKNKNLHLELLTPSRKKKFHFELLTRGFNFCFSTFELLTRS